MFELKRLRLLHELAQRGTIAAVAQALAYSPSTISQQLSQLEREAGVALLAPDGRRVRLTAHGETLAAYAAQALIAPGKELPFQYTTSSTRLQRLLGVNSAVDR